MKNIRLVKFKDGRYGVQFRMFLIFWGTYIYSVGSEDHARRFFDSEKKEEALKVFKVVE